MNSTSSTHDAVPPFFSGQDFFGFPDGLRHACYEGIEDRSWIVDQDREERSREIWPGSITYSPQLSSTARVAALQGKDFGLQDRETAQVVRRSGQEVQDKTEQDRSDLPDRSTRFLLVKQDIVIDHIAHFQQDRPIPSQIGPTPRQDRRKITIC